jgi:hypothetical protein
MKRKVNFFDVSGVSGQDFESMVKEFGPNIPRYLQYEGESCALLFCVDAKINVREIYKKYTKSPFPLDICTMEIDDEKYCDLYCAYPTYRRDVPYELRKDNL